MGVRALVPLLWRGGRRSRPGWWTPARHVRPGWMMRHTRNYLSLPYNPRLKERAKALRRAGNLSEVLLWNQLKKNQFQGLDFDRQKIIGNYIVDFYCAEKNAVIEVDGSSHDGKAEYDAQRDAYLAGLGLRVVHVLDKDVRRDLPAVIDFLEQQLFPPDSQVAP